MKIERRTLWWLRKPSLGVSNLVSIGTICVHFKGAATLDRKGHCERYIRVRFTRGIMRAESYSGAFLGFWRRLYVVCVGFGFAIEMEGLIQRDARHQHKVGMNERRLTIGYRTSSYVNPARVYGKGGGVVFKIQMYKSSMIGPYAPFLHAYIFIYIYIYIITKLCVLIQVC